MSALFKPQRRHLGILYIFCAVLICGVVLAQEPVDVAKQNAQVRGLLAQYRKPGSTPEQKSQIVDQLLELGQAGPQQLAGEICRDFLAKAPLYLSGFERAAGEVRRRRAWKGKGDVEKQILILRKTVLDVSHTADLTKDMIVSKADPAMASWTS